MAFTEEFLQQVRSATDLVELMKDYGEKFRKVGGSRVNAIWECSCPGKKTTNKSRVNVVKQLFNCYSCGFAGNCFNFVMAKENVDFPKAVRILSERAGIQVPDDEESMIALRKRSEAYEVAMAFFQSFASDYYRDRGFTPSDVQLMKGGYAPGGKALKAHMLALGYDEQYLNDIRLINSKGNDSMFKRVVFPVYQNGLIVDIYGRAADPRSERKHFYLNGINICYGIDQVKPGQPVILVESIINAETLLKVFRENDELVTSCVNKGLGVIATGGCTKFALFHVNQLKRKNVPMVFICFDPDASGAGHEHALQAGKLLESRGITSRIMELPTDCDVNDFFVKEQRSCEDFFHYFSHAQRPQTFEHLLWLRKIPRDLLLKFASGEVS